MYYWLRIFGLAGLMAFICLVVVMQIRRHGPPPEYSSIKPGMTSTQVRQVLGQARSIKGSGRQMVVVWKKQDDLIEVCFVQDRTVQSPHFVVHSKSIRKEPAKRR